MFIARDRRCENWTEMSTFISFQTQLVSIMDTLAKTAVLEISKLVDIESKVLRFEITRSQHEIGTLKKKLQLMESMLWNARQHGQDVVTHGHEGARKQIGLDSSANNCSAGFQSREEPVPVIKRESAAEEGHDPLEQLNAHQITTEDTSVVVKLDKPTDYGKDHPKLILIKEESFEVDLRNSELKSGLKISRDGAVGGGADAAKVSPTEHHKDEGNIDTSLTNTGNLESQVAWHTTEPGQLNATVSPGTSIQHQDKQPLPSESNSDSENTYGNFLASQSTNLSKTLRTHSTGAFSGDRRFGCTHCGKRFRCFSQLEIHQRSHTGEKPFRCMLCGKRYAQKGHLYTHQRTHTGEKPYRCLDCGKGFIQKCTLDMHQRTHTGEKPFICMTCGKRFTKKCNLKKHQTVHTDLTMDFYRVSGVPEHQTADEKGLGQDVL